MRVNGPAIRAIRRDKQVSVREIARTAGISAPYLSRIERGLRGGSGVSDDVAAAIAVALAMPLQAIISANGSAA